VTCKNDCKAKKRELLEIAAKLGIPPAHVSVPCEKSQGMQKVLCGMHCLGKIGDDTFNILMSLLQ